MKLFERTIADRVYRALEDTPAVLLHGARQTGKSTLAKAIAHRLQPSTYITFDDPTKQSVALEDPIGFLEAYEGLIVLDEVQRVPELFVAIKRLVDQDRRPGRFLLTGSANVFLLPKLSESLAGRMEILTLWPFSQGELIEQKGSFVDRAFAVQGPTLGSLSDLSRERLVERVLVGGYPEAVQRRAKERRAMWFESYVTTVIHRELRDLSNIEHIAELPRLLRLLASRVGGLMNFSEIAGLIGLPQSTVKRYLSLLEALYLFTPLPAWAPNLGKRLVKRPKIHLCDSGLIAHLIDVDAQRVAQDPTSLGRVLESFVAMELRKQLSWSQTRASLHHFRTHKGQEVDLVLESPSGNLVGIEVKASSRVRTSDAQGTKMLRDLTGDRFHRGIILYGGNESLPLGDRLIAMPIHALWKVG